ncbi:hypothetical protein O181_128605 [Austropuccinia psidii MF-1]|uniref:Uncharacterized protein n=1 Tax=Austropuccinia psidii MF-1 TaxID=1389203 RepID=A0A9Q3Q964_9BASI|nr:hypothetical protein [Austropuccinia psidii MF-1]
MPPTQLTILTLKECPPDTAYHPYAHVVPSRHAPDTTYDPYACVVPSQHSSDTAYHPYSRKVPAQHAPNTAYLSKPWQFTSLDLCMAYQDTVLLWPIGHIHHQWPIWPLHHLMDHLLPFVFWGLHGPSPQSRSHSGNLCPAGYFWSFPSKPGKWPKLLFGHLGS